MICEKNYVPKLDGRLSAAAEMVPLDASLLDVGTDHGYLPVNLLCREKIIDAGASDINSMPLSKAVDTAVRAGVYEKMRFYLSNGLLSVDDIERYNCITVCGMGGEMIYDIINSSEYVKTAAIPLILQPMSSIEDLSRMLAAGGYAVRDERIAIGAGKMYRVMLVRYTGEKYELSDAEHILGRVNIQKGGDEFSAYLDSAVNRYKKIAAGRRCGGLDCSQCNSVLEQLLTVKNNQKGVEK